MVRKIIRIARKVKVTERDRKEFEDRFNRTTVARLGRNLVFVKYLPHSRGLSVDDKGNIFVTTFERVVEKQRFCYIDIYDPDGRYLEKIY